MKKSILLHIIGILVVIISLPLKVFSQQDIQFSQYMFFNSYLNPAATGINDATEGSALYRSQWTGLKTSDNNAYSGTQVLQVLSGGTKIKAINSGVGGYIVNDALGPLKNLSARFNYAYHINIGEGRLSIGIGAGIFNQSVDVSKLNFVDPNDPVKKELLSMGSIIRFDVGGGIFYQKDRYYIGASVSHINNPVLYNNDTSTLARAYYLTGGYNIAINELFVLTPSFLLKSNLKPFSASNVDLNVVLKYNNSQFWGGASFRSGDALALMFGVGLLKENALKVGYSFDLTVIGGAAKSGTSHEIMVTYSKPVRDLLPKPIIRTPRYRF